jgi:hypothetical protein
MSTVPTVPTVPTDGAQWRRHMAPLSAQGPVGLLLSPDLELDADHGQNPCWRVDEGTPSWEGDGPFFAWVGGDMAYSPRQWREKMESMRDAAKGREVVLIFAGQPPQVEAMRVAAAIGDMLGPAQETAD